MASAIRDTILAIGTGVVVTLAWWLSHFPAPHMATAILPSMATTTCIWLSMPALKTWRVVASHVAGATIAAATWFLLPDKHLALMIGVSIVAVITITGLRHAPAVATAAACALHPDKMPQLAMAISIQLAVITLAVQVLRKIDHKKLPE